MGTIINLTNTTNTTNIYDLTLNLNNSTSGSIGIFILFTGLFITLIVMKNWESKDAFAAASFTWSVIAFLFFLSGLVGVDTFFIFLVLGGFGLLQLILRK